MLLHTKAYLVIGDNSLKVRIQTELQPFQVAQGGCEPLAIAAIRSLPDQAGVSAGRGKGRVMGKQRRSQAGRRWRTRRLRRLGPGGPAGRRARGKPQPSGAPGKPARPAQLSGPLRSPHPPAPLQALPLPGGAGRVPAAAGPPLAPLTWAF